MTEPRSHIDLAMARVVHYTNDLVEVRVGPSMRIDGPGIRAAMLARRSILEGRKGPLLFVLEGDPAWDPAILQVDHFAEFTDTIEVVGIAVSNRVLALAVNTYFSLFPPAFPYVLDSNADILRDRLERR